MLTGQIKLILLNHQYVQHEIFKVATIGWCFETSLRYRNLDNNSLYISTDLVRELEMII